MLKTIKKTYQAFTNGIFIGIILASIFSFLSKTGEFRISSIDYYNQFNSNLEATIYGFILTGLIGVLSYYTSKIFNKIDNILYATLLHWLSIVSIVFIIGYIMKWFHFSNIIYNILIITIAYIVIWILQYIKVKFDIDKINEKL